MATYSMFLARRPTKQYIYPSLSHGNWWAEFDLFCMSLTEFCTRHNLWNAISDFYTPKRIGSPPNLQQLIWLLICFQWQTKYGSRNNPCEKGWLCHLYWGLKFSKNFLSTILYLKHKDHWRALVDTEVNHRVT